jgi:hypothetical protein
VPFGHAADRRITTHLSDGIKIGCDQRRSRAQSRCCCGGFGSGMPGTDNNNVVFVDYVCHELVFDSFTTILFIPILVDRAKSIWFEKLLNRV